MTSKSMKCCGRGYNEHYFSPATMWRDNTPRFVKKFDTGNHRPINWCVSVAITILTAIGIGLYVDPDQTAHDHAYHWWFLFVMLSPLLFTVMREFSVLYFKYTTPEDKAFAARHRQYVALPEYAREQLKPLYTRMRDRAMISSDRSTADTQAFDKAVSAVREHEKWLKKHDRDTDPAIENAENLVEQVTEAKRIITQEKRSIA